MSEDKDQAMQAETAPEVNKVIQEPVLEEPIAEKVDEGEVNPEPVVEVEVWDKADLTVVCGKCGHEEKITEAIGGVTLFMATKSDSETKLVCSECDNRMTLTFRNGVMLTAEEKVEAKKLYESMQAKEPVPESLAPQPMTPDEAYEGTSEPQTDDEQPKEDDPAESQVEQDESQEESK
jgi:hypothetical protein